ncbi:autotransporter assembly complex family protein [Methylomarinum sp. Ch1-1]|uniref:Translocation and assembly module subunit TamA n=1 Tax=Methylomarinum roseum TaxID=3067653 RepID=A0AAU7NU02_9GAMM
MHFIVKAALYLLLVAAPALRADEPVIDIEGLTDAQQDNVRVFLSLSQETCQSPAWRIKKLFAKSDSEISKALRALGYYHPDISKRLSFSDDCWQAKFDITAGEPVRVSRLNIQVEGEAQQEPVFEKLLASLPIQQGDILNHALYEKIKQDLRSLALEYGYLNHRFSKKSLRVYPDKNQAEIELTLDSGPRHRFGEIRIDQDILTPDFMRRYVRLSSDDYYSSKKLAQTYNALAASVYFSDVEIKPRMDEIEDNKVPIDIKLTPEKTHTYSVGVGYDTDIGPLGSFGYQNRRLNRAGHHLNLDLSVSPVLSSAEGLYMIPFSEPRSDHVAIGLGYKYEKPDTFESEEAKLSVQYQHLYANGWKQIMFLDLSHETFTISDVSQNTTLLVPGGRWEYTISNDALRPTRGYHINFSLASAPESLISDVTFVQATAAGKLITPLPWPGRLITRVNLGATLTSDFDRLPASYRFYAGGAQSIRGYEYKKLGPQNGEGDVIGGEMLSVVSAEYEHFISESWGVAVFFDAGNAYNANNISIKSGTGLGLRWVSPIGPIRLDFAVPLSDSDSSFQIHFSAGAQL